MLILVLPSRKEKRAHPVPVGQHHLPVCPEPSTDGFGAGGINGNCVYFMSCRKLAAEPSGRLSWEKKKKRLSLMLCVCCLEKYMALSFLDSGKDKKEEDMFSKYQV